MTRSIHLDEAIATRMPEDQAGVRVVRRHHLLVQPLASPSFEGFFGEAGSNSDRTSTEWRSPKKWPSQHWRSATIATDRWLGVDKALDGSVPLL